MTRTSSDARLSESLEDFGVANETFRDILAGDLPLVFLEPDAVDLRAIVFTLGLDSLLPRSFDLEADAIRLTDLVLV